MSKKDITPEIDPMEQLRQMQNAKAKAIRLEQLIRNYPELKTAKPTEGKKS